MQEFEHPEPLTDQVRDVSDGISRLVKEHVELAKVELRANAKRAGFDIAFTTIGALALALGWVLLMFAASYALATMSGNGLSFLIIGAIHVFIGFGLVGVFGSQLMKKDKPGMPQMQEEIDRNRQLLHRLSSSWKHNGLAHNRRPVPV